MAIKAQRQPRTIEQARVELSRRLEARRKEIEAAVMTRVYAVSDPSDLDPEYAEGLKTAVSAAVDYGLTAIAVGEERSSSPPPILLAQARLAARAGVSLDTVLRRYFAGHALLGDFLIEEAEGGRLLRGAALQKLLRTQAALFDRLLAAVSEEHGRERENRLGSTEQRKVERVERLLAGELVDTSGLGYEFGGWHLGVVTKGTGAEEALHKVAVALDRLLLVVRSTEATLWSWFGARAATDPCEVRQFAVRHLPQGVTMAVGEPAVGLTGWRQTSQQARAAMTVSPRGSSSFVRYSEVALLASMLQDSLLMSSLEQLYLVPLQEERDGGEMLRETLRAYFAANRNMSSAAAVLGITRQAVAKRLRSVEERFGCPLGQCGHQLEAALQLDADPCIADRQQAAT